MSIIVAAKATRATLGPHMAEAGMNPPRPLLVGVLLEHDGLTQTEIASIINSDAPTVTKCLRSLEDDGLVTRERDPIDTRAQRVKLTPKGRATGPQLEQAWTQASAELLEPLDAAERKQLKGLLDKISEHHRGRSKHELPKVAA